MGHASLISRRNISVNTDRYCRHMINMILYGVPSDIARNILGITFHTYRGVAWYTRDHLTAKKCAPLVPKNVAPWFTREVARPLEP